jgi:hypothetical protein
MNINAAILKNSILVMLINSVTPLLGIVLTMPIGWSVGVTIKPRLINLLLYFQNYQALSRDFHSGAYFGRIQCN